MFLAERKCDGVAQTCRTWSTMSYGPLSLLHILGSEKESLLAVTREFLY